MSERDEVGGRHHRRYVRGIGQFMALLWLVGYGVVFHSEAAEWSLSPSIGAKGVYNSNLLLTPLPHHDTYGYWITPATELSGKTERLDLSSRLAADIVGYFGGEDRQFTNVFAPLSMRYRTEQDLFGFNGGFIRDNTLLSELQATGVVLQFAQRNQWTFNPTWTRTVTEKLSIQSSVQLFDTMYETAKLADHRVVGGTTGLQYLLTERDQVQLSGSYMDVRTTDSPVPFRANFPGINMSLTHAFDESLTGTVYGGPRFLSSTTQTPGGSVVANETVWLAGASMMKKFERAMLQVSVARDLSPSGFGLLIQTNRGELSGTYDLSETLTCGLNVVGMLTTGKAGTAIGGTFPENRYVSVAPKLVWQFFEWWHAEVSYMYRWRDIDTAISSTESHATTLMVTYSPPKLSWSH
ncbi:hypothetical protein ACYX34_16185 [Nitrospira sp. CMX1]|nr:hypothetical protein [Nitrospira sp.]